MAVSKQEARRLYAAIRDVKAAEKNLDVYPWSVTAAQTYVIAKAELDDATESVRQGMVRGDG